MRKILLILVCVPLIGLGQTWKYSSGGNDFDGKYRTSSVIGTGDDYPYNTPKLVVNYWERNEDINLYIIDAGYFTSGSGTEVYLSFSNENEMIYACDEVGFSNNSDAVFMNDFYLRDNYNEKFDKIEIIEKLMNASYVNIRISNDYGQNTIRFSLRGSSKAITYVIPNIDIRLKKLTEEIEEEIEEEDVAFVDQDIEYYDEDESFEEAWITVEQMPVFKDSCDLSMSESEKERCTQKNIMKFIAKNFRYPEIAKANGIEGRVIVTFVVEKDGTVGRVEIMPGTELDKDIDKEAIRVIEALPLFEPGKQIGKAVPVKYTVPIKCTLG